MIFIRRQTIDNMTLDLTSKIPFLKKCHDLLIKFCCCCC